MTELLNTLRTIVGDTNLLTGSSVSQRAKHFWNPEPLQAMAIVRPASTEEVSQVLKFCYEAEQPVVTHGGNTGLVDGEHCDENDIVLSLERMCAIESIDATGRTITVQAGCVLASVHHAVNDAGLLYGLDLGARGSCTIGGNLSTNAGGLSVLRYGMTRDQVLGVEAVLADGTIVSSMNAMLKNNAGYDLKQLFIGSEGTLGVITRAVLRLRTATPYANTAMLAFTGFDQVCSTLDLLSKRLNGQLNAFEVIWNPFYRLATDATIEGTVKPPLETNYPIYVIAESQGNDERKDYQQFEQTMADALSEELVADAVLAQSEKERQTIWQIRENVDLVLSHSPVFVYDISLPIQAMQTYLDHLESALKQQWPQCVFYAYGHMADGNLHISVAPAPENFGQNSVSYGSITNESNGHSASKTHSDWHKLCNNMVYDPLKALGGSISAEHGIGLAKKSYLAISRSNEEIALMKNLKQAMDPRNILNPGKIF